MDENETAGRELPVIYRTTEAFWEAARNERLLIQRCVSCAKFQWYPRGHCSHCLGPDLEWVEAEGTGKVHTFTVVERSTNPGLSAPYVFAIIELSEGVRMVANLLDVDPRSVVCEMPVRVTFEKISSEITLPQFTPEREHHANQ